MKCAAQLQYCPLCRGEIVLTVHDEETDSPSSPASPTSPSIGSNGVLDGGGDVFPAVT